MITVATPSTAYTTITAVRLSMTPPLVVAACEVVVGLGLIVAMGRRQIELDVDKLRTLRG